MRSELCRLSLEQARYRYLLLAATQQYRVIDSTQHKSHCHSLVLFWGHNADGIYDTADAVPQTLQEHGKLRNAVMLRRQLRT